MAIKEILEQIVANETLDEIICKVNLSKQERAQNLAFLEYINNAYNIELNLVQLMELSIGGVQDLLCPICKENLIKYTSINRNTKTCSKPSCISIKRNNSRKAHIK